MNVLIIPSWYPHKSDPSAGKFFVEQASALARSGELDIQLLDWGQNEFQLQIKHPLGSLAKLARAFFAKHGTDNPEPNLSIVRNPHITWYSGVSKGNIASLAKRLELPDKPDLIHAHVTFPAGYLAILLSRELSIPYLITEHSGPFPFAEFVSGKGISPLILEPLRSAKRVIAVSTSLKQELKAKTGLNAEVIPNLVDTDFYTPADGAPSAGQFRIFALSRFTEAKGSTDLWQALKLLHSRTTNWHLVWGGSGPLLPTLRRRAQDEGLLGNLSFPGNLSQNQALEHYRGCDCFVMASRIESFSMVLIEALACGKPVVATNCGGPRDILNAQCGILVPKQNPVALADALDKLSKTYQQYNPELIRKHCIRNFGHEAVTGRILALYRDVLASDI